MTNGEEDFEAMLELSERLGEAGGLAQAQINTLPTVAFAKSATSTFPFQLSITWK